MKYQSASVGFESVEWMEFVPKGKKKAFFFFLTKPLKLKSTLQLNLDCLMLDLTVIK